MTYTDHPNGSARTTARRLGAMGLLLAIACLAGGWALEIAGGDWLGEKRPVFYLGPLFPYFLAVVHSLFGESTLAAAVIQALLSALTAGLIYHLGRQLFGWVVGLVAGLMAAIYAMFIFFSSLMLGATLILFLNLLMLVNDHPEVKESGLLAG